MELLKTFLNKHKAENKGEYTHTSMGPPFRGSFYIPQTDLPTFHQIYKKVIESGTRLHLTEKHKDVNPILIDIDFRFPSSDGVSRKYTEEHIKKIVSYYQAEIRSNFIGDCSAYVYEKGTEGRLVKTRVKDGIHIMFPFIVTEPENQLILRKRVVQRIKDDMVFSDLNLANDEWDIFDEKVINNNNAPWTMYGSCKSDDVNVYTITHIFDSEMDSRDVPETRHLIDILSLRNKNQDDKSPWKSEECKQLYKDLYHQKYKSKVRKQMVSLDTNITDLEQIKELVDMLDPKRADDYQEWVKLGWCLHNISPNLLPVWEEFSKKSVDKYEEGRCSELWDKARSDGGLNMGTLYYWARKDSPEKYKEFKGRRVGSEIQRSVANVSDHAIAKVLYMMFGHKYVLASLKEDLWFEFVGHSWRKCEKGIFLRQRISNDLFDLYVKYAAKMSEDYLQLGNQERTEQQESYEKKTKNLLSIYHILNTTKKKNDIMKAAQELFYYDDRMDKKFVEKLDSNRDLIGFKNGVYDLAAPRLNELGKEELDDNGKIIRGVFREGRPDDYISMGTNINYIPFDPSSEEVYLCQKFVKEIFPDPELRRYVMTMMSYCLSGHISEEKMWIMLGTAANGKSALLELFKHAFGDYYHSVSPKILTTPVKNPEAASPVMAQLKGKRFVTMTEPEKDDVIQGGAFKGMIGGDEIIARGLFKEPVAYKPQFKIVLLSNYFLRINTTDEGVFRRLRAVECKVKFCDDPNEDDPYQKKIDRRLKDSFPDWAEAFMSILIENYSYYEREGLIEPEEVKVYTKKYQQDVDIFLEYMDENVVSSEASILSVSNVYTHFKNWFKEQSDGRNKAPLKKELKAAIEKKYGQAKRRKNIVGWNNICLADELGEEEEDNETPVIVSNDVVDSL